MNINLHIDYFEEGGQMVALCPELQVSSFGDTLKEAERSIREALELFLRGCQELGTLEEVLEESGFVKVNDQWTYRMPMKSVQTSLQLPGAPYG
ncbi:MAG: type II toxin-antitoxin system HicB family antitoxin [bacterium]